MSSSYKSHRRTRAVSVRVPEATLHRIMRARKVATQSQLINTLLAEEEERLEAERVLRETTGAAAGIDFDDRLL
ncbi:MAG: hypothetical protein JW940_28050 [Polyangiaceae bacterium]|nr:hypothetical protein [Polyangiaceae bacterium]